MNVFLLWGLGVLRNTVLLYILYIRVTNMATVVLSITVERIQAATTHDLGVLWSAAVHGYYCTRYIEL